MLKNENARGLYFTWYLSDHFVLDKKDNTSKNKMFKMQAMMIVLISRILEGETWIRGSKGKHCLRRLERNYRQAR